MAKTYEFQVVIERDEDGVYIATVPAVHSCHTHAKNIPTLMKRIKEALELCLEVQKDIHPLKFIGLQEVEVTLPR